MNKHEAINLIEDVILKNGYEQNAIRKDFKYIDKNKSIRSAEIVAFSDLYQLDVSTSCISVCWIDNGSEIGTQSFWGLGTPIILLASADHVSIYEYQEEKIVLDQKVRYDLLEKHFSENRLYYSKDTIMAKKQAYGYQQLTLFALEVTKEKLIEIFENSFIEVKAKLNLDMSLDMSKHKKKMYSRIVKVAIHTLAACILEDKLWGSLNSSENVIELINTCSEKYPNYFKNILISQQDIQIAQIFYENIRSQLTFNTLTNNMLGHFYEYAILDSKKRNLLGIYWTEESIANKICQHLPFELISRENIVVLDGTCGSASLLTAACTRIKKMLPVKWPGFKQHDWITDRVIGVEQDQFSAEIAKLSLLLFGLPHGNKWNIINTDFFKIDPKALRNVTIIIGNPPFKETKTDEKANIFMDSYLDILMPGGIMGIILPETYLESNKSKNSRKKLLGCANILEIWYLPEGAFRTSNIATVVLLIQKQKTPFCFREDHFVKVSEIKQSDLTNFKLTGGPSLSYVKKQEEWIKDKLHRITSSYFDSIISSIKFTKVIGDIVSISQGIIPYNNADFSNEPLVENKSGKCVKWIQSPADDILQPYSVNWRDYRNKGRLYTIYPGKHHRSRPNICFERPKILLNSVRNSSGHWRLYGTIDYDGYYVSQSFWVLGNIKNDYSLEEIIAVINHPISSIIINKFNRRAYIQKSSIAMLPIPDFTPSEKKEIICLVNKIIKLKKVHPPAWQLQARSITNKIDKIVYDAFKISKAEQVLIGDYMSKSKRPGDEWLPEIYKEQSLTTQTNYIKTWKITGIMEEVNENNQEICLSADEYPEKQWISIPKNLPGWALIAGQAFEAEIPFDQRYEVNLKKIDFLKFRLSRFSYLSDKELDDHFNKQSLQNNKE